MNGQDLKKELDSHIDELIKLTSEAAQSDAIQKYLNMCAKFHSYSIGNMYLIMIHRPDATHVAGFNTWKKLGRFVKKGEKGIPILAPIITKKENSKGEETTAMWFKTVYVFDIAQTDGEPLVDVEWSDNDKSDKLHNRLLDFCDEHRIVVKVDDIKGEALGYSYGGSILLDTDAGIGTFFHEVAHELLHKASGLDKHRKELEAEAVSYVCCRHFGINTQSSPNYIALWSQDRVTITECMERIQKVSKEIIEFIEEKE